MTEQLDGHRAVRARLESKSSDLSPEPAPKRASAGHSTFMSPALGRCEGG
jgi:hypothetical protein